MEFNDLHTDAIECTEALALPLKRFGIDFFALTAANHDHEVFAVGSDLTYGEAYINSQYYHHDVQAKQQVEEYILWDQAAMDKDAVALYQMAAQYGHSHTLTISRNIADTLFCYHFSARTGDSIMNSHYFDHMNLLHTFIEYFTAQLQEQQALNDLFRQSFSVSRRESPQTPSILANFNKAPYLTAEEIQILKWIRLGKSAELIAAIMHKSRKTIERKIAAIKEKLGCLTLYQLGENVASAGLTEWL